MTTNLLLALALIGRPGNPGDARDLDDLAFIAAVEEFARPLADAPPAPFPGLFRRMGASDWRGRDRASRDALDHCRRHPGDARFLFWGRHHPDREVGLRCNGAIRALWRCGACGGDGACGPPTIRWACTACGGTGTAWPLTPWD